MSGRKRWTHLDQMVGSGIIGEETIRNSDVLGAGTSEADDGKMERASGIEPLSSPWKGEAQPLDQAR